jgi:hypothetical protein
VRRLHEGIVNRPLSKITVTLRQRTASNLRAIVI